MSLLLDALKKAALEKRKHDQQMEVAADAIEASSTDDSDAHFYSEESDGEWEKSVAGPASNEKTLTFEIEFPDAEVHTSVIELQNEAQAKVLPVNVPESLQEPLSTLNLKVPTDSWPSHKASDEEQGFECNPDVDDSDYGELGVDTQIAASEASVSGAATPSLDRTSLKLADEPGSAQQSQRKAALSQLLGRSQQSAARNRKRKLYLLGGLLLVSIGIVALYYYYLLTVGMVQTPMLAASNNIAASEQQGYENNSNPESEVGDENIEVDNNFVEKSASVDSISADSRSVNGTDPEMAIPPTKPAVSTLRELSSSTVSQQKPLTPSADTPVNKPAAVSPSTTTAKTTAAKTTENIVQYQAQTPSPLSLAIREGYTAYQQGDLSTAQLAYEKALQLSEHHRDALLGAAAVAFRQGRQQEALRYYQHRLARAPKDDYALAGILAMANAKQTGPELDSEINRLLIEFPEASHLHFLKGSLFAARQQWGSAQLSFFNAWRWDSTKADYAYNLAVALDHLTQPAEALRFYRQAVSLSVTATSSFNAGQVHQRIDQLEGQLEGNKQ